MLIADTNEFHPLLGHAPDGSPFVANQTAGGPLTTDSTFVDRTHLMVLRMSD